MQPRRVDPPTTVGQGQRQASGRAGLLERAEERDNVRFLPGRRHQGDALFVETHEIEQILSRAVMEYGAREGQAAKDSSQP